MQHEIAASTDYLTLSLIFLVAAVVAVPLAKRLKLGSVMGYLAAGILVGPQGLRLIGEAQTVLHVSELGIVMFMFLIGLEMKPSRMWSMRRDIFGLGALQVVLTGLVLTLVPIGFGRPLEASIIAGFGLALTSTAILMQILNEGAEVQQPHGQRALAVSIFQDLTIVPLLALVAFLSPNAAPSSEAWWIGAAKIIGAVLLVILSGRYVLNPLFAVLARANTREIMTAAALMVVIGASAVMTLAGLSMATGAFLAGVFLAESRFRHQLEADIEPFRGLLMGLFFMSIGMTIDPQVLVGAWWRLLIGIVLLILLKAGVMYALMRLFGYDHPQSVRASLLMSQAGEFGFVLFAAAVSAQVMPADLASILAAVVVLSMALAPFVYRLAARIISIGPAKPEPESDFSQARGSVLLIGFGRFGQVACQLLLAEGIDVTIIDNDIEMIESAGKFGHRVYYGDGSRYDVLRAAGAERARLICICTDGQETTTRIVDICKGAFPLARIFARSYDRRHTIDLIEKGVDFELRELYESAIVYGRSALEHLGLETERAREVEADMRQRDQVRLTEQRAGGILAGADTLYIGPGVRPEPLTPVKKPASAKRPATVIAKPAASDPTLVDGGAGL
ncbi:MAG: monovalent cation:proton antiporter-2 (CPA2) family protein [Hyphomicrobiales bacterium]|nr:monovalent cation:proton antiporter-2 (CPA2) family protein [Hyphomicrobiales bacterium]OQW84561.1 MAG: hypothetical protein BVN31_03010 [Proteobacteria bacterium ST_bin15]